MWGADAVLGVEGVDAVPTAGALEGGVYGRDLLVYVSTVGVTWGK